MFTLDALEHVTVRQRLTLLPVEWRVANLSWDSRVVATLVFLLFLETNVNTISLHPEVPS